MKAAGPRKLSQIYIQSLLFTKCRISPVSERESIGDSNFFLTLTTELLGYTFWKKCVNNFRYACMFIVHKPTAYVLYFFLLEKCFWAGKYLVVIYFFLLLFWLSTNCSPVDPTTSLTQYILHNICGNGNSVTIEHIFLSNRTLVDIFAVHKPSERISFSV